MAKPKTHSLDRLSETKSDERIVRALTFDRCIRMLIIPGDRFVEPTINSTVLRRDRMQPFAGGSAQRERRSGACGFKPVLFTLGKRL